VSYQRRSVDIYIRKAPHWFRLDFGSKRLRMDAKMVTRIAMIDMRSPWLILDLLATISTWITSQPHAAPVCNMQPNPAFNRTSAGGPSTPQRVAGLLVALAVTGSAHD
jgi:hypothetical protein